MAKVIGRAIRDRQRPLRRDVAVPYGSVALRLTVGMSTEVVDAVRRRPGTHNARRTQVETMALRRLHAQYEQGVERALRTGLRTTGPSVDFEDFADEIRELPVFREALDRMWPLLTPEELLHDLFGAPPLIDLAARRFLNDEERAALHRARSASLDAIAWTSGDIALLDEAAILVGPRKKKVPGEDALRTFGHVVVDEAQDLSPMQLRMLARRSLSGSMTIVGDIGQATGPMSPDRWDDVLKHLPDRKPSRLVELTVNYRTPAEIMEVANRVLAAAVPHLRPPQSVRSGGEAPAVLRVRDRDAAALAAVAAEEARRLQAEIGGMVAILAPAELADAAMQAAGTTADVDLDRPVTVVPLSSAKGLEFDGVVLLEPALVAQESPQGLKSLYVAMTRATKRPRPLRALPAVLALNDETEMSGGRA